jgi:ParB family transcriptional regulator, chromosome partitioning protein
MPETPSSPRYKKGQFYEVELGNLNDDPDQPRKHFDSAALQDLTDSIKARGVLQPILFRVGHDGRLFIVAGERRCRAAVEAKLKTIPAMCVDGNHQEIALIENVMREDLTAIELAEALGRMKDEHGYKQSQLTELILLPALSVEMQRTRGEAEASRPKRMRPGH